MKSSMNNPMNANVNQTDQIEMSDIELDYKNFYESQQLLWGIPSFISPLKQADVGGINDAELIYDTNDEQYLLCIESIYQFEDNENEFDYFNNIKDKLMDWFIQQNFTLLDDVEYGEYVENWCFVGYSIENVVSQFICYFNDYFRLD